MDLLLSRRRRLPELPAPFRCGCGSTITEWHPPHAFVAKCSACERQPEYHLLRSEVTVSGDAREWVIAARGVVQSDRDAFEKQGFHTLMPTGARFVLDVPTITGELTNEDGSLKSESTSN